jgi:hypothetical protein
MRKKPEQSYEEWISAVKDLVISQAQDELSAGIPVEQVLENLSARFFSKAMHPLYKEQEQMYQEKSKNK